jgi:hypothetical protein
MKNQCLVLAKKFSIAYNRAGISSSLYKIGCASTGAGKSFTLKWICSGYEQTNRRWLQELTCRNREGGSFKSIKPFIHTHCTVCCMHVSNVAVYAEIHTAEYYLRSWLSQSWYRLSLAIRPHTKSVHCSTQFHHRTLQYSFQCHHHCNSRSSKWLGIQSLYCEYFSVRSL